jgi:hypothetical protein
MAGEDLSGDGHSRRGGDRGVAMMRKYEGKELDFCHRLLAITRVILEEKRAAVPDRGWGVIVIALFVHMLSVLRAALTLAVSGHGRELPIMIRPGLEALITLMFITQQNREVRARRWVEYTHVAKRALMNKHAELFEGPAHEEVRREIEDRARSVAHLFPGRSWASGLGCSDLRVMAEQVGLLWYYDAVYWTGSQPTHATAMAVDEIIGEAAKGGPVYKVGLSGKDAHRELAAYCDLLIRGLLRLDEVFNLGIEPIAADLKADYVSLFGKTLDKGEQQQP